MTITHFGLQTRFVGLVRRNEEMYCGPVLRHPAELYVASRRPRWLNMAAAVQTGPDMHVWHRKCAFRPLQIALHQRSSCCSEQRMGQVAGSEPADAFLAWAARRENASVAPQGLLEVPCHIRGCTKSVIQLLCRHSRVRGSPGENALDAFVPRYPPNRFVLSCTHFRKHLAPVSNDPSLLSSAASARWSSTKRLA